MSRPRPLVPGVLRHDSLPLVVLIHGFPNPDFADPDATAEALATLQDPAVPTLYLHGADDGALGVDIFGHPPGHLPAAGSAFEIIDGTGHFLHLEQPEVITARITDWLG